MTNQSPADPVKKDDPADSVETASGFALSYMALYAVPLLVVVAVLFVYLRFGFTPTSVIEGKSRKLANQVDVDNPLEQARESLSRANDLATCRSAIQQINTYLTEKRDRRPPQVSTESAAQLQKTLGLRQDELEEIEGSNYKLLDAHHLDRCFLFHDAAAALAIGSVGNDTDGKPIQRTALERAQAAFDWVVREVRLYSGRDPRLFEDAGMPPPPQFIVRRGSGSALERALVFLALLEGFRDADAGLHGCLVTIRDKDTDPSHLWSCGVLTDGSPDIYLFDPALGLPLPGKDGKGIATLQGVLKDPGLLNQLQFGETARYDVTAAQVAGAQVTLVFSLSALSPRMRYLQDELLPPLVRINLAEDPAADFTRWSAALAPLGMKAPHVVAWQNGAGLARQFLPESEGGVDKPQPFPFRLLGGFTTADDPATRPMTRREVFDLALVPWPAFPELFRDKHLFPYNIGLGLAVRKAFAAPFVRSAMEPGQVRDLQVRGHYDRTAELLVQERDRLLAQESQLRARGPQLVEQVNYWVQTAIPLYADQLRARSSDAQSAANQKIGDLWKRADPVFTLLGGAMALQRGVEATFLLGLCKHEEAALLQARLDLSQRAGLNPSPHETTAVVTAWKNAATWWRRYLEEYPTSSSAPQVRRLFAAVLIHIGGKTEAKDQLEDLSGPMTPQEKVAHLALARQIQPTAK